MVQPMFRCASGTLTRRVRARVILDNLSMEKPIGVPRSTSDNGPLMSLPSVSHLISMPIILVSEPLERLACPALVTVQRGVHVHRVSDPDHVTPITIPLSIIVGLMNSMDQATKNRPRTEILHPTFEPRIRSSNQEEMLAMLIVHDLDVAFGM